MERLRLLIVEDRPDEALLLRAKITRAATHDGPDIEAVIIGTGAELAAAMGGDPDIILLDLGLPDMEAVETMRHAATLAGKVPIVVHSGHADREVALQCIELGAQDFVSKNAQSGEELLRAILFAVIRSARQTGKLEPRMTALARRLAELV